MSHCRRRRDLPRDPHSLSLTAAFVPSEGAAIEGTDKGDHTYAFMPPSISERSAEPFSHQTGIGEAAGLITLQHNKALFEPSETRADLRRRQMLQSWLCIEAVSGVFEQRNFGS